MSATTTFTKTHEFRIEKINGNASSLLASIRKANEYPDRINNKYLCSMVSEYISKYTSLNSVVSKYGDEIQLQALSILCRLVICIVTARKTIDGSIHIDKKKYGESIESLEECIYILYDEAHKHYDPLYVINLENLQKVKVFQRNDEATEKLLNIFLKKQFNCKKTM